MTEILLIFDLSCEYILTCIIDTRRNITFGKFLTRMFHYFKIFIVGNAVINSVFIGSYFESLHVKFKNNEWLHKFEYLALMTPTQLVSTPPSHISHPPSSFLQAEPSSSTSAQPIPTPYPTFTHDSFGQILSILQKLNQRMDRIEEKHKKIMKDIKGLSKWIDCVEHGQLLGMSFSI